MCDWPSIEYEDCYPVDEDFVACGRVSSPPLDFTLAGEWLLRELPRACEHMCCSCKVNRSTDDFGKPVHRIYFSTGGWSGAESIVALINRRADLKRLMLSWRRGGHYVFEIPIRKPERSISEIRKEAWATRRARYGQCGHRGIYRHD